MLLFGHAGIATAVAKGTERLFPNNKKHNRIKIHYAVVIIGALLPDIIDKSLIGFFDNLNRFGGHFVAHSYWFGAIVAAIGIIIFLINRHLVILILGLGSLLHVFMDAMIPILNKPVDRYLGKYFSLYPRHLKLVDELMAPVYHRISYLKGVLEYLFMPTVLVFEIIGLLLLLYFCLARLQRKR